MKWRAATASCIGVIVVVTTGLAPAFAQAPGSLAGRWTLNRALSQFPDDVGFGADLVTGAAPAGSGGAPSSLSRLESEDDAMRARQLTEEVRTPPARLMIAETPTAITVTDDGGRSRTFHPGGREEAIRLDGVSVAATAKFEAGRLVIVYKVQRNRELRYTYSRTSTPPQLIVDVQFIERGGKGSVRRVYEPGSWETPLAAPPAASPAPAAKPAPDVPAAGRADAGAPAIGRFELPTLPQRPGDEFKGLHRLAVVVEDLGSQATSCGLKQATIETTASKSLSDAGLTVVKNSDEDTYLYVNVNASKVSPGFCVSRYDVMVYTHVTARLPYGSTPVLVQVSLLRDGGMAGGDPASNGDAVLRAVKDSADRFAARIRDANK